MSGKGALRLTLRSATHGTAALHFTLRSLLQVATGTPTNTRDEPFEFDNAEGVCANTESPVLPNLARRIQKAPWIPFSTIHLGATLEEDADWQFQWGRKLGKHSETYLVYDGAGVVEERTEMRTSYSSVTMQNRATGIAALAQR